METPEWLAHAMADDDVTDICINGEGEAYVDRGAGLESLPARWTEGEAGASPANGILQGWVVLQLSRVGRAWDARQPFVDATLESGHRLHAVFPPLARNGVTVSLRKPARKPGAAGAAGPRSAGLARWKDSPLLQPLIEATRRGETILISGATGSGKTTLLSDLLSIVPERERLIALEDTPEIAPAHPHFVSLMSRPPNADGFGEVTLRTLLKQTLRMRPDRIILGECRGDEVLDLLQALNTGHRGSMATLHANSPRDALRRAELLCLLAAGGTIPVTIVRELLAVGVQWIAQVKRTPEGRRITELSRMEGREGDTILLRPVLMNEVLSLSTDHELTPAAPAASFTGTDRTRFARLA